MTQDFDIDALPPSSKGVYRISIPMEHDLDELIGAILLASKDTTSKESIREELVAHLHDGELSVPILAARGVEPGETFVTTAGVHGDEYEGILAIHRIFDEIDPARMNGIFIAVPVVTLPAFWLGSRVNPFDGRNMARVFPGSHEGTSTERVAAKLLERVLRHASLYIDLHSAGGHYHMLTLCGYVELGAQAARAREACEHFDAPFIWEHPSISPGRTLSATLELDIPSLYAETYGGGARAEDVAVYARGVANLLKYLEIADLPQARREKSGEPARRLHGSGDLDFAVNCSVSGVYDPSVELGGRVSAGDVLGVVRSLDGKVIEQVRASEDGLIIVTRATPRVYAGEQVAALASETSRRST